MARMSSICRWVRPLGKALAARLLWFGSRGWDGCVGCGAPQRDRVYPADLPETVVAINPDRPWPCIISELFFPRREGQFIGKIFCHCLTSGSKEAHSKVRDCDGLLSGHLLVCGAAPCECGGVGCSNDTTCTHSSAGTAYE